MASLSWIFAACGILSSAVLAQDASAAASTSTISFASSQPSGAVTVPSDFVGFGFDTGFLNSYDNALSNGLIDSVAKRMSAPPIIRVGGTTGDRVSYDPSQKANTTCIATSSGSCPYGDGVRVILGPSYFKGFQSFTSAHMSFQAPLSRTVNISNVLDYVTLAYKNLGADRTAAIAIGNEVGGYENTAQDYVNAVHTVESSVTKALGLNGSSAVIFEVLDLASGQIVPPGAPWTLPDAFNDGINNNSLVKFAAEHWYQRTGNQNVQQDLMNHSAIVDQFQAYNASLNYLNTKTKGPVRLVLSEVGSELGGPYEYTSSFGAAMWSADFQLLGASQGIARIAMSGRPEATHALWVPIPNVPGNPGPAVRANYVTQHFVAEFLYGASGGASPAAHSSVVEMPLGTSYLTAYAAYEAGKLARVALLNLNAWAEGNGTRGEQTFQVAAPSSSSGTVSLARMQSPQGYTSCGFDNGAGQNVTFAGQQWAYKLNSDGGPVPTTQTLEAASVSGGMVTVTVPDTEAVIIFF